MKARLYGSFTAVLNLTTDKAPTRPRERAKEDLTTAIKAETLTVTNKIVFPNPLREEKEFPNLQKIALIINPEIVEATRIAKPS